MQAAIAERLLRRHRPHTSIGEGTTVVLCSQETYTSRLLESMLTGAPPPKGPFLLHTIPEELLISFAARHNIPIIREEKSDVRRMVERIAKEQPQTFFSLARSMGRLGIVPDTDE